MTEGAQDTPVAELLDRLEAALVRLAGGTLPPAELVEAGEEQAQAVDQLRDRLRAVLARLEAES